jgi:hypothetical protein
MSTPPRTRIVRLSPDRLSLRGLTPTTRALALLLLLVIAAAALLVAMIAVGLVEATLRPDPAGLDWATIVEGLPLGSVTWLEFGATVPLASVVLLLCGASVIAATIAHGIRLPGWPFPRLSALGVALVGGSLSALLATRESAVRQVAPPGSIAPDAMVVLGWIGIVGAAAFLLVDLLGGRIAQGSQARDRTAPARMLLAATPFMCLLIAVLVADAGPIGGDVASPRDIAANVGLWVAGLLFLATQLVVMWGVLALARTARRIGTVITPAGTAQAVKVLVVLLGVKAAWIIVGLEGRVPDEMVDLKVAWSRSRADGDAAWALALALALAFVVLAVRLQRRASETGVRAATWLVILGISATVIGSAMVLLAWPIAIAAPSLAFMPLAITQQLIADMTQATWLTVVLCTPLLGILLWRIGLRSAALVLGTIAIWAMPRALAILDSLLQTGTYDAPSALDALIIEPVTMDIALTAMIALGTIGHVRRWRLALPPSLAITLLVTVSMVTYAGKLVPADLDDLALCGLLVYPVFWSLGFDARALNVPGPARATRILSFLALMAGLLALSTLVIGAGAAQYAVSLAPVTQIIVLLPYAALIVIVWWGRVRRLPSLDAPATVVRAARRSPLPSLRPDRLPRREAAGWAALGTFVIVCLAGLLWLDVRLDPPRAFVAPGEIRSGAEGSPGGPGDPPSILGLSDALPAGMPFDVVAHLQDLPRGTAIILRFSGGDPPQDLPGYDLQVEPGQESVVLTITPDYPMAQPGHWVMEAREDDEILARGSYTVSP